MKLQPSIIVLACSIFHIFIIPKNRPLGEFFQFRITDNIGTKIVQIEEIYIRMITVQKVSICRFATFFNNFDFSLAAKFR